MMNPSYDYLNLRKKLDNIQNTPVKLPINSAYKAKRINKYIGTDCQPSSTNEYNIYEYNFTFLCKMLTQMNDFTKKIRFLKRLCLIETR